MTDTDDPDALDRKDPALDRKHARNREHRLRQIKAWAEYVRTHPDDDWGEQVNLLVNSQLQSARHHEDERPDIPERE